MSQIGDLLSDVAKKDSTAFQQLYDLFADRVYRYAFTILHDKHLAEEIAQETMVAVWNGADRFAGRSKASTWIFGIARNQALTLLRKEKRAENAVLLLSHTPATLLSPPMLNAVRLGYSKSPTGYVPEAVWNSTRLTLSLPGLKLLMMWVGI